MPNSHRSIAADRNLAGFRFFYAGDVGIPAAGAGEEGFQGVEPGGDDLFEGDETSA